MGTNWQFCSGIIDTNFYLQRLQTLRQYSTVDWYRKQFELLHNLVLARYSHLSESYLVSCCMNGFKEEIREAVQLFYPVSVEGCFCIALMQECLLAMTAKHGLESIMDNVGTDEKSAVHQKVAPIESNQKKPTPSSVSGSCTMSTSIDDSRVEALLNDGNIVITDVLDIDGNVVGDSVSTLGVSSVLIVENSPAINSSSSPCHEAKTVNSHEPWVMIGDTKENVTEPITHSEKLAGSCLREEVTISVIPCKMEVARVFPYLEQYPSSTLTSVILVQNSVCNSDNESFSPHKGVRLFVNRTAELNISSPSVESCFLGSSGRPLPTTVYLLSPTSNHTLVLHIVCTKGHYSLVPRVRQGSPKSIRPRSYNVHRYVAGDIHAQDTTILELQQAPMAVRSVISITSAIFWCLELSTIGYKILNIDNRPLGWPPPIRFSTVGQRLYSNWYFAQGSYGGLWMQLVSLFPDFEIEARIFLQACPNLLGTIEFSVVGQYIMFFDQAITGVQLADPTKFMHKRSTMANDQGGYQCSAYFGNYGAQYWIFSVMPIGGHRVYSRNHPLLRLLLYEPHQCVPYIVVLRIVVVIHGPSLGCLLFGLTLSSVASLFHIIIFALHQSYYVLCLGYTLFSQVISVFHCDSLATGISNACAKGTAQRDIGHTVIKLATSTMDISHFLGLSVHKLLQCRTLHHNISKTPSQSEYSLDGKQLLVDVTYFYHDGTVCFLLRQAAHVTLLVIKLGEWTPSNFDLMATLASEKLVSRACSFLWQIIERWPSLRPVKFRGRIRV